jgi:hypothetical protein
MEDKNKLKIANITIDLLTTLIDIPVIEGGYFKWDDFINNESVCLTVDFDEIKSYHPRILTTTIDDVKLIRAMDGHSRELWPIIYSSYFYTVLQKDELVTLPAKVYYIPRNKKVYDAIFHQGKILFRRGPLKLLLDEPSTDANCYIIDVNQCLTDCLRFYSRPGIKNAIYTYGPKFSMELQSKYFISREDDGIDDIL